MSAEPVSDVPGMTTVLALLAPEQPIVNSMIELLFLAFLIDKLLLQVLKFLHRVEYSYRVQTDCA